MTAPRPRTVAMPDGAALDALLQAPASAFALLVLAHGAGAGMTHPFLQQFADAAAAERVATFRFQFPSMQAGRGRVDAPAVAHAALRAARDEARRLLPGLPCFAGGKSFGGRMTTQAEALSPDPALRGIVLLGFPLHAAGKPGTERAAHLAHVAVPMLFLQGDRDALATVDLMEPVVASLGERARMQVLAGADHSFALNAAARRGADAAQPMAARLAAAVAAWMRPLAA